MTLKLDTGIVSCSNSPWSSPVVLVKKRDGGVRFCDYRRLNAVTVKDSYPLSRIDDTLDALSGPRYFTTLDLAAGYWQVPVAEEDKKKTAFVTQKDLWQFNKMPFGLANAPATFQRMMEVVLAGLQWSECLIYLDDVIVFSSSFDMHMQRLGLVFERLEKANLKLKPSECQFVQSEVCYLEHAVSEKERQPNSERVKAVSEYPSPKDVSQLKTFLGMAGYYRRFIPNFSETAAPLYELLKKEKPFEWSVSCEKAFTEIREKMATRLVLSFPDFSLPFELSVDASEIGLGAVLQQTVEGSERVVSFASRTLHQHEKNYSTIEKEMLAIVWAIGHFRCYLYGKPFLLKTYHQPFVWLKSIKEPQGTLARWLAALAEYEFSVQHIPGKANVPADALSRRVGGREGRTVENKRKYRQMVQKLWTK